MGAGQVRTMRFFRKTCLAAGLVALLVPAPASAEVELPVHEEDGVSLQIAEDEPAQAGARVFLAAPVGVVVVGAEDDPQGTPRYAARQDGQGAGVVRFSSSRPSQISTAGAGSLPAGLPLARSHITSRFGARRNPVTGVNQRHAGVDLAAPTGAPVVATGDGVVAFAGPAGNYGLLVAVDHGNGVQTRYAHLSRLGVRSGQSVRTGDVVGLVGSTGRSTGPHLHYEIRARGHAIDPLAR